MKKSCCGRVFLRWSVLCIRPTTNKYILNSFNSFWTIFSIVQRSTVSFYDIYSFEKFKMGTSTTNLWCFISSNIYLSLLLWLLKKNLPLLTIIGSVVNFYRYFYLKRFAISSCFLLTTSLFTHLLPYYTRHLGMEDGNSDKIHKVGVITG